MMKTGCFCRPGRAAAGALALLLSLPGCALLAPEQVVPPARFVLEAGFEAASASTATGPLLLVAPPAAGPGLESTRMLYVRRPYEQESFARSEWVDAPAKMLAPLLVQALGSAGFRAVGSPGGVAATLRLDTEILSLQQEFTQQPSRARFALRAQLVDVSSRTLVATRELEAVENAPSDDPYGGVLAANRAVTRVLRELAEWARAQSPGS